jgi:hypothetical protein
LRPSPIAILATLAAGLPVAACGESEPATEDGLTAAEERRLDEAAQRLDREREGYEAELAAQARADAQAAQADSQSDGENAAETP